MKNSRYCYSDTKDKIKFVYKKKDSQEDLQKLIDKHNKELLKKKNRLIKLGLI